MHNPGIVSITVDPLDYAIKKRNFFIESKGVNHFSQSILDNVMYAHVDMERLREDDQMRPHTLILGVAERHANLLSLHRLLCSDKPLLPDEVHLVVAREANRVVKGDLRQNEQLVIARRIFTTLKLRAANTHYSKLHGSSEEVCITRLVFGCFLKDIQVSDPASIGAL